MPLTELSMISATMTVDEAIRRVPTTIMVFNRFGIDACCGAAAPIAEAAERDGADAAELLAALRQAARAEREEDAR